MINTRFVSLAAIAAALVGLSGCAAGIERREDRRDDRQERRQERRDYTTQIQPAVDDQAVAALSSAV